MLGHEMSSLDWGQETCEALILRCGCNHVDLQVHGSFAISVHSIFSTEGFGISQLAVFDFGRRIDMQMTDKFFLLMTSSAAVHMVMLQVFVVMLLKAGGAFICCSIVDLVTFVTWKQVFSCVTEHCELQRGGVEITPFVVCMAE